MNDPSHWLAFLLFVALLLWLDLRVMHRGHHRIGMREALLDSAFWIGMGLLFGAGIFWHQGADAGWQYFTGFIVEKSLSVDNLFVFLMIFQYFKVPEEEKHTILFYGILGALVLRALFILGGLALLHYLHWTLYVFGAFLIYTGIKLVRHDDKELHPEKNLILRTLRTFMPVHPHFVEGGRFFTRVNGRRAATLSLVVLLFVETTDVLFAVDSIPAILAISRDPFLVYSSNVFAILGLRALFFALAGLMDMFRFLNYGLCVILVFIGSKMMLEDLYPVPTPVALAVIGATLATAIALSRLLPAPAKPTAENIDTNR